MIDSIFLNGTVGVGKSTVADTISSIEVENRHPHAVIDLDQIHRVWPAPKDDRFSHELELTNLHAIAANYRAAGVRHFILPGVIEDASEVSRYGAALESSGLLTCRLDADAAVVEERLRRRHDALSAELEWHLDRASELAAILRVAALDDCVIDTSLQSPREVAEAIMRAAGWI